MDNIWVMAQMFIRLISNNRRTNRGLQADRAFYLSFTNDLPVRTCYLFWTWGGGRGGGEERLKATVGPSLRSPMILFGITRTLQRGLGESYCKMSFIQVSHDNHFPIQNIPYGVFSTSDDVREYRSRGVSSTAAHFHVRFHLC